jgi:hypothetical protein
MKLFSYCIPIDDGAAPNPYWDWCTLVICKPVIRRVAKQGDWIIGVGSKNVNGINYAGTLVYAMKVTMVMKMVDYDSYCINILRNKLPDISNDDFRRRLGDCIYDFSNRVTPDIRPSVHNIENRETDLAGENALLSNHFYYFGDAAIEIPKQFSIVVRQGQGHQSTKNHYIKDEFVKWIQENFETNKIYGNPQLKVDFNGSTLKKNCGAIRHQSAELDEEELYEDEQLPLGHWTYFLALEADLMAISRYVELHQQNYGTFSIGLTQLLLAACSEIDVVLKQITLILSGEPLGNMKGYGGVMLAKVASITNKKVSIPRFKIELTPFSEWTVENPPKWWTSHNNVKHHRNTHYEDANLGNTLNALGGLYILIYELIRIHKGKSEQEYSGRLIFEHLQPRQEIFLLEGEDLWRDIAEGKRGLLG